MVRLARGPGDARSHGAHVVIDDRHRIAVLAAIADDGELEECIPPEAWALATREGAVEANFENKRRPGLQLTDAGRAFLKRALA